MKRKMIVGGLIVGLVGLSILTYSKKSDFVKLSNVKNVDSNVVSFDIKAHDDEGIRELAYRIDGRIAYECDGMSSHFMYKDGPKEIKMSRRIMPCELYELEKGIHCLNIILKDCDDNNIERIKYFKVK